MSQVPSDLVSPSGQSTVGSLLSGEADPTLPDIQQGRQNIIDFFNNIGASLGSFGAFLQSPLFIVGVIVIVVLIIVALIKK